MKSGRICLILNQLLAINQCPVSKILIILPLEQSKSLQVQQKKKNNYVRCLLIIFQADLSIALPSDLWMSIFALLSVEPHQVWWRILSEVSKHTNHSLKLYLKHIQFARFHSSSTIAEYIAGEGYLSCLQYAHENGARWDVTTCMNANLDCLKYAHESACEWNELTCYYSALHNRVDCLKYAHEHGCEWTYTTAFAAAKNNHLECLKYCYENGCPRAPQYANTYYDTSSVMSTAASNGSLDCIKYLHEQQGESWTEALLIVMTKYGHLDCIKYAIQRGTFSVTATLAQELIGNTIRVSLQQRNDMFFCRG